MISTSVRPHRRLRTLLITVVACAASLVVAGAAHATVPAAAAAPPASSNRPPLTNYRLPGNVARTCGTPQPGHATCFALRRTDIVRPHVSAAQAPPGLAPDDLVGAYQLPVSSAPGPTVAIVDAFDGPTTEKDLATYRATYGLPACTTANGCFRKVNQNGRTSPLPAANRGWAAEISLDVDMVSAVCPQCRILLVEANSDSVLDLMTAVHTAVSAPFNAKYVSNSYGADWDPSAESLNSRYTFPGVAMVASTGDFGYGPSFPATVPAVTAVGGTSLQITRTASGTVRKAETAWAGSGSGCASTGRVPHFQADVVTRCNGRAQADVAAVADPQTGVATYDSYGGSGWAVAGGTSASAPIIASIYALAGAGGNAIAAPSAYPYRRPGAFNDVISGSNVVGRCTAPPLCQAGRGWDGITGLGTPRGISGFSSTTTVGDPLLSGGPSLAARGPRLIDLVARNARKQMMHRYFNGSTWSPWAAVAGVLNSQPSVTAQSSSRLDAVALDSSNRLIHTSYSAGRWSPFDLVNATPLGSAPSIVSLTPGRLDVVARSTSGHLLHMYNLGRGWSRWEDRGGVLTSAPTITAWKPRRLDVAALDSRGVLVHYSMGTGGRNAFDTPPGGALTSAPSIGADAVGHLQVVARGTDRSVLLRTVVYGRPWGSWSAIGGPILAAPSITSDVRGHLWIAVVDAASQVLVRTVQNGRYSAWSRLGGTIT